MDRRLVLPLEAGTALLMGGLSLLAVVWPDWIESVFGVDPDQGTGSVEWAMVAVPLLAMVLFGYLARRQWRRLASVS